MIVNYNTRELLTGCLNSVFASRCRYPFRVILVDNNSTDGSAELVRTHYPQVTLLESARNGGFGYANNIALRALAVPPCPAPAQQPAREIPEQGDAGIRFSTDYILFLNPDTVLPRNALEVMVDVSGAHAAGRRRRPAHGEARRHPGSGLPARLPHAAQLAVQAHGSLTPLPAPSVDSRATI